ncbi:hypothetical protein HA402_002652 [Bradysia odoriphaga]|nr:hypothetical protein HA402_002652 [Bradysia odoriphaga]
MGSLGPPSPSSRPRASTAETPGYYVAMSSLNNRKVSVRLSFPHFHFVDINQSPNLILQPTPPKKPPRRNLSVSPTHLDSFQSMMSTSMDSGSEMSKTPRTGAYEYLFLARSGAKSHSDLDEFEAQQINRTASIDQYVMMSPSRHTQQPSTNKSSGETAFRSYNPNRKLRRNRDNYFSMDRGTANARDKNCTSVSDGYLPMSPSNYKQPPTPEHPPPTASQAEKCILDRIRPLSQEYKRRSMNIHDVAERGTSPPDPLYASSGSLSSSVSLSDRSASTDCVEEFIGDMPFAGELFHKPNRDYLEPTTPSTFSSSSPNQTILSHRISPQFFDHSITNHNRPERPKTLGTGPVRKTVSMESSQYSAVPVAQVRSKQDSASDNSNKTTEISEQRNSIGNGAASKQTNNSAVLSPFDEQEEWAKISEIMAAFGTDLLIDGSNNGTRPNRTRVRGSISSTKSLGSPMDPPPTPLSLLVDWLYDNELEELERVLVSHGYDDYYFINGILHDEDIEIIGVPAADRPKLSEAITSLPLAKPIIENNNENSNLSIAQWLHEIRLDEYADVFRRHLIMDMDRICRIWEIELQTVIEIHKIGHRKRMLHSVGLPTCKKKDEKRNHISAPDANADGKCLMNKKEEGNAKTLDPNQHTNGQKTNHGKNRPAPQPPNLSTNLEIRAPSELLLGVPTGLKTQWRHTATKLVSSSVRYENVNYLGSTLVKELRGTESTRKSIQKLKRGERMPPAFNGHISQDSHHRPIILSISHRGVQFFETNTQSETKSGWAPITGAVGIVFVTIATPTIGRKRTFEITASTFVFGWILITYTKSCEVFDYFQVIVAGHAIVAFAIGATYPISSIYLVETIRPELFGILGVIPSIFFNGGTLLYNTIHDHFTYTHIAFFAAALHIIFFVLTLFLNESPPWLAAKKLKMERAEGKKTCQSEINDRLTVTSEVESVFLEIEYAQDTPAITELTSDVIVAFVESDIKQTIDIDGSTTVMQENKEKVDENTAQNAELDLVKRPKESTLFTLVKIPKFSLTQNFNPLVVALQLIFLANYSGMSTIQLHMVKFYEAIDSTKDENYVFRLIDKIKLGGSLVSLVMIVVVTRKNLLYLSFSTMAFSLMALGSYFFIKADNLDQSIVADYQWIPFVLSIVFIVGYSVGIGSIVWLVMVDVLPETFRDILATVATSFHWMCIYGIFILFKNNRGKSLLYTDVLFWMHGFICIYGIMFVKSCIPDFKGCSLDDLIGMLTAES